MTYVLSDIHGHYDKYQAMLREIEFQADDTLYVLGDVIDRGPNGIAILQDMMLRPNVIPILGNHEFTAAMCIPWLLAEVTDQSLDSLSEDQIAALGEWITNGGGPTLRALKLLTQEEREELLEYFQEMEVYAEIRIGSRSFVLVHAGLENFSPDKPLDAYALGNFLFGRPQLGRTYFNEKILIFGHTPTPVLRKWEGEVPSNKIIHRGNQIAIDCGCGFDGPLGCLCLDSMEEFYI